MNNSNHKASSDKNLEQRLKFETLMLQISARFIANPYDKIDSDINDALRSIMEFFQVDRCALLEIQKDMTFSKVTHVVYGEGVEQVSGEINLAELFPWCYEKLTQGEIINISRVEDYPEKALKDRQSHVALGIKSALNIPVAVDDRISRSIVIQHTHRHHTWPDEYIPRLHLLGEIFVNALERRESRLKLEEQLRFETLLSEISARFVNLPVEGIDSVIEDALHRICELLHLDRSTLWQISAEEPASLRLTHWHLPPESQSPPEGMNAMEFFPWTLQKNLDGKTIIISKLADLPPEAGRDMESFRAYNTKSTVIVPLSVGEGPVFGVLGFAIMREERIIPEKTIVGLKLIAQVFANALTRKQQEMALRESEAKLSVATEAAGAGLWVMEINTNKVWVSPAARELFRFAPDEDLTYQSWFKVIHPDDHKRVHEAVQKALQSGENINCDYRIILPDGTIRWIVARGQRHIASSGEADRLMGVSMDITGRKQMEEQLKENLNEIYLLKQRLESENVYLKEEINLLVEHAEIVGQSAAMKKILNQAEQVARTDSTVLLLGETGTGKELLARAIHTMSSRKVRPLVTINCASLPSTLIESELFGREKGAYTGALTRMVGRFEIADGSTLFLDEIGELPLEVQSKLLRFLEEGSFERLGSTKSLHVNVRIIAATNRDIQGEVAYGKFRKDLFYRLNVFPIVIPPLRERSEDIPLLVLSIVKEFQKRMGKEIESIPKKTMEALKSYSWPGNVRELRNLIEHAMILSQGKTLDIRVPKSASSDLNATSSLRDMERLHLMAVLEKTGWRISGPGGAAEILDMKRTTLQSKLKKLGIKRTKKNMPK